MATYKVWLTVKDSYGNTKEVDGGTINVDLATLTPDEVNQIGGALPLNDYLKKDELHDQLDSYATEVEVDEAIQKAETIRYSDFKFIEDEA